MPENPEIRKKYQKVLDAFVEEIKKDNTITAVLLCGSLAKGIVWEKSDIDLFVITSQQNSSGRTFWLMDGDVSSHVTVMTRNEYIRIFQMILQGSSTHHIISTTKVLFSNDRTLDEFIESMKKPNKHELQLNMLTLISLIIPYLEKAEKYLYVMNDIPQSYLFITRLLDNLASVTVMLNNEIPGREAVEQAMEHEPELFKTIYSDVILNILSGEGLALLISEIRRYIELNTPVIFDTVIEYFRNEAVVRSVTDLTRYLTNKLNNHMEEMASGIIGNWLAEQGYLEKVPCPARLTLRSRREVSETGYYYIGE